MDRSFHNSWQDRWSGLADRLEVILEKRAYRLFLCWATVILVVGYVAIASRLAEPPRWVESRLVHIDDSFGNSSNSVSVRDVDSVNRSIVRLEKLASVLALKPQRLNIKPSLEAVRAPFEIETHILRLWIDEVRGFYPNGTYEVTTKSIADAIIALVFQNRTSLDYLQAENSSWYAEIATAEADTANPARLIPWLTRQLIFEGQKLAPGRRISYLRSLVNASADSKLLEFERTNRWPADARDFGKPLQQIVSILVPARARDLDFRAVVPWLQVKLGAEGSSAPKAMLKGLHVGLLVVTSCRLPRLIDFKGFNAHEVVWARMCPNSFSTLTVLIPAETTEDFAAKNPDTSFAQVGVLEIIYALEKGWINSKTDISDFIMNSHEKSPRSKVAAQIRPQSEEWDSKAQAFRVKAPIEVLKLVRLRSI